MGVYAQTGVFGEQPYFQATLRTLSAVLEDFIRRDL
jgi:hypothetical protein